MTNTLYDNLGRTADAITDYINGTLSIGTTRFYTYETSGDNIGQLAKSR